MSERLRLEAEFRDRGVQAGVKKIAGELATIRETPGMTQATKWLGDFNQKANSLGAGRGIMTEFMTGLAVGGLSAAASVAGLVKSFADLADHTAGLKEVARQTGLTVDQVNVLQKAGERLYIDPSKMAAGLEVLSDKMFDFRRHMGELFGELNQFDPDFSRKLALDKPEEQIKDIFNWLSKIKDPVLQRRWTEAFMGDGDLARLLTNGGRDFAQAMQDAASHAGKITPELQAQAQTFHDAVLDFNDTWEAVRNGFGPAVLKGMTEVLTEFREIIQKVEDIEKWWDKVQGHPAQIAADIGGKLVEAAKEEMTPAWLKRAQEKRAQDDLAGLGPAKAEDSNALHKSDTAPVDWLAKQKALKAARAPAAPSQTLVPSAPVPSPARPSVPAAPDAPPDHWWNKLLHRSSFESGDGDFKALFRQASFGDGSQSSGAPSLFGSPSDIIAEGTKLGVLAAFRELMGQRDAKRAAGGAGLQNAAFETWDSSSDQSGQRGRGGGAGTGGGIDVDTGGSKAGSLTELIEKEAKRAGIDPRIMEGIRAGESLHQDRYDKKDDAIESSWGPFQLNRRSGLGVQFEHDTGKDLRDPTTIAAQARWVAQYLAKGGSLSAWAGFHGPRDADPRWGESGYRPDPKAADVGVSANGAGSGIAATAVDNASKLLGMGSSQVARALGKRMTPGEWCADFVTGALQSANVKGSNSSLALSFKAWGRKVLLDDVKKGDVLVEDHGGGHGHAGLATGNVRRDASGRVTGVEMISGNHGHQVGRAWERPDELAAIRRAPEPEDAPRRTFNLPEVAAKAAPEPQTFKHEGGASIDLRIRPDGSVKSSTSKTHGLVTAVNLSRGHTMMMPGVG